MSDFVPYSEKQKILTPAQWEEAGFLDQDCQTAQVAAQYMRTIVSRLLKIDKNGDINDFEFLVYESRFPNAGFVSSHETLNGKNIIAISTTITKLCENEEQFAAVLGHELGHYTYYKAYGENKNTIIQEGGADGRAIDFLIAGGYNPAVYRDVCDNIEMQMGGKPDIFDVHPTPKNRKQIVDTYLTYKRQKEGDFKVLAPTGQWSDFAKIITSNKDRYESYFSQLLQHKFPDGGRKPSINQIFDLILSELKKGRLNSRCRVNDMLNYIDNYNAKTKPEIQSTQNFIEQLINIHNQDPVLKKCLNDYEIAALGKKLKTKFHGGKPFKVFHPVDEYLKKIDEFMKTRDPARVKELAMDLHNNKNRIFDISDVKNLFGKPTGFKMPPRAIAKGYSMPTDWLCSVARAMDIKTRTAMGSVIRNIGFDCDYKWLTDNGLNSLAWMDEYSGKIIATSEKEIDKLKEGLRRQEKYKEKHNGFNDFIYTLNVLYEFDRGQISVQDVIERLKQYDTRSGRKSNFDTAGLLYRLYNSIDLIDFKHENTFLEPEIRELIGNPAFAEFYIKPFIKMFKTALNDVSPKLASQIRTDNPPQGKTWFEYLLYISSKYLKLKEVERAINVKELLENILIRAGKKVGVQDTYDLSSNVPIGPIIEHISRLQTEKQYSVIKKFVLTAMSDGICSQQEVAKIFFQSLYHYDYAGHWNGFVATKIVENVESLEYKTKQKLDADALEQYSIHADKNQWISDNYGSVNDALDNEIEQNTDLHKIHRLLTAFGMVAKTEQELISILSKPITRFDDNGVYELETRLKEYALIYYMRKNPPIKNIYSVLSATCAATCIDNVARFRDYFSDELADYIEKNNLWPTDFRTMYDLNAVMQKLNVFSKEKSNHSKVLNFLVEKIENMPPQSQEEYSWNLLSGFYYPDTDARCILNRKSDDIDLPLVRNKLLEIYSTNIAKRFGRDDNSDEYFAKIQKLSEFINQEHIHDRYRYTNADGTYAGGKRRGITKTVQGKLYRLITDKIQSQERVSQFLANDSNIVISDEDIQKKDLLGRGVQALLEELEEHGEIAIYSIEFLNRKLTAKSIDDYRKKCATYGDNTNIASMIYPSMMENFYNTFWSSDLKIRSIMMNTLLSSGFKTLDERIKYVCDMNFGKDSEYRADAETICECVIKSFEPYEQNLILAAVASADENKEEGKNASRSVGDGLRMFFESMGPAWVKFGQLLSYVPDLPSEIRRDLGKLKDRADIPARWDVYTWLREALPNDLYNRIERVEDIVGAGSFWMTAVVQFKNDQGKPEKKVIQLLRPNADARADAGFKTIETAIGKLARKDPRKYRVLRDVARQAHKSAKYEVDANVGNKQYERAKDLYGDIVVSIDGTKYTPHVADWRYFGPGYKIMDYAPGTTLSRVEASEDERRKMALAYFTIEMVNLFKGDVWDIDRHQGQQNFDIISPTDITINIYDTGAQLPNAPDNKNKVLLANIFFGLTKAVQSGKSIESYLLQTIKRLDKLQKLNVDVSYVSNVQKGLMALSDIIEYQKEIKDKDGRILQERKTLSADDLKHAITAVLQNPTVDKYISAVIKGRVVAKKLSHLEIKALQELREKQNSDQDNPIKIIIVPKAETSKASMMRKAVAEITASIDPDDEILGIPKKHIKTKDVNSVVGFDDPQKVA